MNIGQASRQSGVSAKMIRHYESIGLLPAASRTLSNYRVFTERDVSVLKFIHRARQLGFSLENIGTLLSLWNDRSRPSSQVKALAQQHIADLSARAAQIEAMVVTLKELADRCSGDDRPDCPILETLEGSAAAA